MIIKQQYPLTQSAFSLPLVTVGVITLGAALWGLMGWQEDGMSPNERLLARLVAVEPVEQPELPDFSAQAVVQERKDEFFNFMVPMIREENARLEEKREALLQWQSSVQGGEELSEQGVAQLTSLASRYYVETEMAVKQVLAELLVKVDTLPTSVVVAQAANESAWGTSRFAREGNNLFGQWCFSSGCGIVPNGRPEGETYEVRSFASPAHSVRSFIQNLNRHLSYEDLRLARAEMREQQQAISGLDLAPHLLAYSTRREEYVEEIISMINFNNLLDLDQ
ncbi:MAG: glucosaminidase domain-containing protein [Natronospirillum sp.]